MTWHLLCKVCLPILTSKQGQKPKPHRRFPYLLHKLTFASPAGRALCLAPMSCLNLQKLRSIPTIWQGRIDFASRASKLKLDTVLRIFCPCWSRRSLLSRPESHGDVCARDKSGARHDRVGRLCVPAPAASVGRNRGLTDLDYAALRAIVYVHGERRPAGGLRMAAPLAVNVWLMRLIWGNDVNGCRATYTTYISMMAKSMQICF
jgi:hypothetical protein